MFLFLGFPKPTGSSVRRENKSSSRLQHYIRAHEHKGGLNKFQNLVPTCSKVFKSHGNVGIALLNIYIGLPNQLSDSWRIQTNFTGRKESLFSSKSISKIKLNLHWILALTCTKWTQTLTEKNLVFLFFVWLKSGLQKCSLVQTIVVIFYDWWASSCIFFRCLKYIQEQVKNMIFQKQKKFYRSHPENISVGTDI